MNELNNPDGSLIVH